MVRARAIELAVINGRRAQEASKSDREQPTGVDGESDTDRNKRRLNQRPNPNAGPVLARLDTSAGGPSADEDEDDGATMRGWSKKHCRSGADNASSSKNIDNSPACVHCST